MKRGVDEFMSLVDQPLMSLRGDLHVTRVNEAFCEYFKIAREEVEGRLIYDIEKGAWDIPSLRNLLEAVLPERNRVSNFVLDHQFKRIGDKKLSLSARRLMQRGKGTQLTLLTLVEMSDALRRQ
jgi:two-component system, chemotaxis family, CheB/CheR fusion protein